MLEAAAAHPGEARADAMFALILIYNRERRYDDALRTLRELRRAYPRNRLVVLEMGSTALRAGRAAEADGLLTEGLGLVAREGRPLFPGEEALWRYKRGAARAALQRVDEARADLTLATDDSAQPWVGGRAHLELARLATGKAAAAHLDRAEALCAQGNDPHCLTGVRQLRRTRR